jgi:hypothetical protein
VTDVTGEVLFHPSADTTSCKVYELKPVAQGRLCPEGLDPTEQKANEDKNLNEREENIHACKV